MSSSDSEASSVAAFEQYVRPVLQRCASCHADTQAPKFMAADSSAAHTAALPRVNFDDISKSRFLERILIDGHNCGSDCRPLGESLRTALKKWRAARVQNASSSGGGKETVDKLLTGKTEMTWEIGSLISPQYQDKVNVSLTIEPDDTAKVYRLNNLRVHADEIDVFIGAVTPLINGERQQSTTFSQLNCKIPATTSDSHAFELTVMTTGTSIAPTEYSAANKLSLAFEGLRVAKDEDDTLCWNKNTYNAIFTTNIKPILSTTCMRCHRPPTQPDVAAITVFTGNKNTVLAILKGENTSHQNRRPIQNMSDADKTSVIEFLELNAPD